MSAWTRAESLTASGRAVVGGGDEVGTEDVGGLDDVDDVVDDDGGGCCVVGRIVVVSPPARCCSVVGANGEDVVEIVGPIGVGPSDPPEVSGPVLTVVALGTASERRIGRIEVSVEPAVATSDVSEAAARSPSDERAAGKAASGLAPAELDVVTLSPGEAKPTAAELIGAWPLDCVSGGSR